MVGGEWRRWLPFAAVVLASALALSDWPVEWPFWIDHPLIAALAAGVALLFLTGAVVDSYVRRREARRWVGVGRAAAIEFAVYFEVNRWVMPQLLGVDFQIRVWPDVDFHLTPARVRAAELLPVNLDETKMVGLFMTDQGSAEYEQLVRARLPLLVRDSAWRTPAFVALHTLNRQHAAMIAQWTSLFAVLGDDARFAHVSQTVEIMDRIIAMTERSWLVDVAVTSPAFAVDETELARAIEEYIDHWVNLTRAYAREHAYWTEQVVREARIPVPQRQWARDAR